MCSRVKTFLSEREHSVAMPDCSSRRSSAPWYAPELGPLLSVAAATLNDDGTLIAANAGFLKLLNSHEPPAVGACVAPFFIGPDFASLVGAHGGADGEVHRGLLTIGDAMGATRTLRARVWRVGGQVRVLAEYDVEELERLSGALFDLNREYADAQLELAQTNLRIRQREAEIVALSLSDPLTGVGNRRALEKALALETRRAERTGESLCAVMADLDHFKRINDTFGHDAGDKVLAAFGDLLRRQTRGTDVVARFGGEEFVVLMPHTDLVHATDTAERIREALASSRFEPLPDPVTVSIGVAELAANEPGEALLRRADRALYEAKQSGRDRVVASAIGDRHARVPGAGVLTQP
jgi:two-component system, cell cycle response regulator